MPEGELVVHIEQQRGGVYIDGLAIEVSVELGIVDIAVQDRHPPFGNMQLCADRDACILPVADIAISNNGGMA